MDMMKVQSIAEMHRISGLRPPKHPQIVVLDWKDIIAKEFYNREVKVTFDLYMISYKEVPCGTITYGLNTYGFEEGVMVFTAPGQIATYFAESEPSGWALFFHPDLIRNTSLGTRISEYSFFSYEVHEALHISEEEKKIINDVVNQIENEYSETVDAHSARVIVSYIELLLNYASRFYERQFDTRSIPNNDVIAAFEKEIKEYFVSDKARTSGLPTVTDRARRLNMSPDYLSDMLKQQTGMSAQEHIHIALIDHAKNLLMGTKNSVKEIATSLGFDYPQYFNKLFKAKTGMTPIEFRRS